MIRKNWQMYSKAISKQIIDNIIKNVGETKKATTFNKDDEARRSSVSWVDDPNVLNILYNYVENSNKNAFHVNIFRTAQIQYTEYNGNEKGHYNMHHDIDWNRNDGLDRKLSVTVQLSDPNEYEGGQFEFTECESPNSKELKQMGTVLVFPSYLVHKVNPVTSGIRKSLVAWFEGPKWV